MKNKIIVFFLIICITITSFVFPVFAKEEQQMSNEGIAAMEALYSLGVINADEDEIVYKENVSRAEAIHFINKLIKLNVSEEEITSTFFIDVGSKNPYIADINAAYSAGIINGDGNGNFNPDDAIRINDFLTCIMRAAGYTPYMNYGDYTLVTKYQNYIMDGAESGLGTLDTSAMMIMLKNALFIPYMYTYGIITDGQGNFIGNYSDEYGETLLKKIFKIDEYEGMLVASDDLAMNGRELCTSDGYVVQLKNGADKGFKCDDYNIDDFMGYTMKLYAYENENDIIYYSPIAKKVNDITIDGVYLSTVPANLSYIKYYTSNFSREKTAKLAHSTVFVYNGRMCYDITTSDFENNVDYVRLIDTNLDDVLDIVYVYNYQTVYINTISATTGIITDKVTKGKLILDEKNESYDVEIFKDGKKISVAQLSADSSISVAVSKGGKVKQKKTVIVSDTKIISGVINGYDEETDVIIIDGKERTSAYYFDYSSLKLGEYANFAVNYMGLITDVFESNVGEIKYGYALKLANAGSAIDERYEIQIFTPQSEVINYGFVKNFKLNDVVSDYKKLISSPALFEGGNFKQQLVSYQLTEDNKISRLYYAVGTSGVPGKDGSKTLSLNEYLEDIGIKSNMIEAKYRFDADTAFFSVILDENNTTDEDNIEMITTSTYSLLTNNLDVYVYDADYFRTAKAAVMYTKESDTSSDAFDRYPKHRNRPFVIEKVYETLDEKGNARTSISGYEQGKYVKYYVNDGVNVSQLDSGECINTVKTINNDLRRFYYKFAYTTPADYNSSLKTCLMSDGDYSSNPAYMWTDNSYLSTCIYLYGEIVSRTDNTILFKVYGDDVPVLYTLKTDSCIYRHSKEFNKLDKVTDSEIELETPVYLFAKSGEVIDMVMYK